MISPFGPKNIKSLVRTFSVRNAIISHSQVIIRKCVDQTNSK